MQVDILNRFTGLVQLSAAVDCAEGSADSIKVGLAVRWAIKANAILAAAALRGADLARAELRRADLNRVDLADANLVDVNLARANLAGADLTGANLRGAFLLYANLRSANLARANLAGYVVSANLAGADLRGASLAGNLMQADLSDANLAGADLTYADLARANLAGADLTGAELMHATLVGANVAGADFTGATHVDLAGSLNIPAQDIPAIPGIDAKILAAIEPGGKLEKPHLDAIDTRAHWAIRLAGQKGEALKDKVGSAMAGALIYRASRPGKPAPWLFASVEQAMADIRHGAAEQTGQPLPDPTIAAIAAHRAAASDYWSAHAVLDALVVTGGTTEQIGRDCDAADLRLMQATEVMIGAERTLMATTPTTEDGMAALKGYVRKTV